MESEAKAVKEFDIEVIDGNEIIDIDFGYGGIKTNPYEILELWLIIGGKTLYAQSRIVYMSSWFEPDGSSCTRIRCEVSEQGWVGDQS